MTSLRITITNAAVRIRSHAGSPASLNSPAATQRSSIIGMPARDFLAFLFDFLAQEVVEGGADGSDGSKLSNPHESRRHLRSQEVGGQPELEAERQKTAYVQPRRSEALRVARAQGLLNEANEADRGTGENYQRVGGLHQTDGEGHRAAQPGLAQNEIHGESRLPAQRCDIRIQRAPEELARVAGACSPAFMHDCTGLQIRTSSD